MGSFLYDTSVFVYALGREHPYRDPCRAVLERALAGDLLGDATVDLVQEFLHHRTRQLGDRVAAGADARLVASLCRLHATNPEDVELATRLFEQHRGLNARDAFFAAVAINRGVAIILATDRAFDDVPGLRRVDPADAAAVDALTGRV